MASPENPRARRDPHDDAPRPSPRVATYVLVGINALVFAAMLGAGVSPWLVDVSSLVAFGGVDARLIWQGEPWRLLTGCFVHVAAWHVAMNMWILLQVGRVLERMIGSARYVLVYVVSGMFGFAASVILHPGVAAGASGAVLGVTGALLGMAVLTRHASLGRFLLTALVPFVAATLALGFLVPLVDNTAHVGGVLMGFLLGIGLEAGDRQFITRARGELVDDHEAQAIRAVLVPRDERAWGMTALVVAGVLFVGALAYAQRPIGSPRFHVLRGLDDLLAARAPHADPSLRARAAEHAAAASRQAPDDPATLLLAGRVLLETNKDDADGRKLVQAALRAHGTDVAPGDAFERISLELRLISGDEQPYTDEVTVAALCDAALVLLGTRPDPDLKNNCAWLRLKALDPDVHDAAVGLALALAAVADSGGTQPSVVHTLAEAQSQNANPQESVALLERMIAQDGLGGLSRAFVDSELRRFRAQADELRRSRGGVPHEPPAAGVPEGQRPNESR